MYRQSKVLNKYWLAALMITTVAMGAAPVAAHADDEGLIEVEESFADSEAAIAEEEEARIRAQDEKVRAEEAKRNALREAEQAKKIEAEARKKAAIWSEQEKKTKAERLAAEKRIAAAQERQRLADEQMRIAQIRLDDAKAATEKAIVERDQADLQADGVVERKNKVVASAGAARQRYKQTLAEVQTATKRIESEERALAKAKVLSNTEMQNMKAQLLAKRKELRALEGQIARTEKNLRIYKIPSIGGKAATQVARKGARLPASDLTEVTMPIVAPGTVGKPIASSLVPASAARPTAGRTEGWVRVKHDCDIRTQTSKDSIAASRRKVGDRLYAKKSAPGWMSVRLDDGRDGYMSTSCFR